MLFPGDSLGTWQVFESIDLLPLVLQFGICLFEIFFFLVQLQFVHYFSSVLHKMVLLYAKESTHRLLGSWQAFEPSSGKIDGYYWDKCFCQVCYVTELLQLPKSCVCVCTATGKAKEGAAADKKKKKVKQENGEKETEKPKKVKKARVKKEKVSQDVGSDDDDDNDDEDCSATKCLRPIGKYFGDHGWGWEWWGGMWP